MGGGVDHLQACHRLLDAKDRNEFKKSKYVQSNSIDVYASVKKALVDGFPVLFTGVPCQIAALRSYLGRDYENLYLVDLVCHGVVGQGILNAYIKQLEQKRKCSVKSIEFRYKKKDIYGEIHSRNLAVYFKNGKKFVRSAKTNSYLRGYHSGLFYRESWYSCPFASSKRNSDITIGDYWHIQDLKPELIDYTGVSCILANSAKGANLVEQCESLFIEETPIEFLFNHNGQLRSSVRFHPHRTDFLQRLDDGKSFDELINKYLGKANYFKVFISKLLPGKLKRFVKKLR